MTSAVRRNEMTLSFFCSLSVYIPFTLSICFAWRRIRRTMQEYNPEFAAFNLITLRLKPWMTQRNGDPQCCRTPPAMAFHNQSVLFTFKDCKLFEACDMSVRASKPFRLSWAKKNNKKKTLGETQHKSRRIDTLIPCNYSHCGGHQIAW